MRAALLVVVALLGASLTAAATDDADKVGADHTGMWRQLLAHRA